MMIHLYFICIGEEKLKRLKKIVLIVIVLVLIGSVLPDSSEKYSREDTEETVSKTEDSEEEDEIEDSVEPETTDVQEVLEEKKEEVFFTKERSVNEAINKYNERYPDNPVEPDMVEYWMAGGGNYATDVTFDDFSIHFGEGDGDPMYNLYSDIENNEENKEYFVDETIKWIAVIFNLEDEELESIYNNLMYDDSEIRLEFISNKTWNYKHVVNYEEDGTDNRLNHHNYTIFIHPAR